MDSSTFVLNQTQMIILTDPNADYNDVPVDFGPTFFDVLNAMADAVGEMMFTIGLSMQDPSHDMDEIELAWTARRMLGDRLDSMLLGNVRDHVCRSRVFSGNIFYDTGARSVRWAWYEGQLHDTGLRMR